MRATSALIGVVVVVLASLGVAPAAHASKCPPASVGGKTIGWVEFDDVRVPIKRTDYPAGGALVPPASNRVAGMSTLHQGLIADQGTTVIAWHERFGPGCPGTLNPLLRKKMGDTFDIVTTSGQRQSFTLTESRKVKRGRYQRDWFRLHGDRQVTLFTCSDLRNGRFINNRVLVAVPTSSLAPDSL